MLKGLRDGREGEFRPGDIGFCEKFGLKTFDAREKIKIQKPCFVKDIHLRNVRQAENSIERIDLNAGIGLFHSFSQGAL